MQTNQSIEDRLVPGLYRATCRSARHKENYWSSTFVEFSVVLVFVTVVLYYLYFNTKRQTTANGCVLNRKM